MQGNVLIQMSNQQLLLQKIKEKSPITKRELQNITGFSWGLISREVNALVDTGYIVSDCRKSIGAGRKAEEYDINNDQNYFIGIDFNYKGILVVVTDMKGRIVEQSEKEFAVVERECVLQTMFEMLDAFFEKFHDRMIMGIGIATQGVVNRVKGVSVFTTKIKDWNNVPLKQILEARYHVSVSVEHDPDCIMKTESAFGHLNRSDVTEAIVVSVDYSVGVGMSIMINGEVYHGFHGKAAEIGYTIVNNQIEGPGKYLEDHMTKVHIVQDYRELTKSTEEITYREIVERAENGDLVCINLFEKLGEYIGRAICSASNFLNPEMIVIHAPTCDFQEMLFNTASDFVAKNTYDKSVKIKFSKLGKEARAIGGALIAIEKAIYAM